MNDRELLELAAKAAGIYWFDGGWAMLTHGDEPGSTREWNPLTDDGDALRLAVKLGINIGIKTIPHAVYVEASNGHAPAAIETLDDVRGKGFDHYAATRRAIVRAAAEIGKAM